VATHRDLRAAVADGRFRADLYHRVALPEVVLPPLRARFDEIPFHIAAEIARASPRLFAHAALVEACLLRPWPGNVRELRRAIQSAASLALAESAERVRPEHLAESAGLEFVPTGALPSAAPSAPTPESGTPAAKADAAGEQGRADNVDAASPRRRVQWSLQL